MEVSGKGKNTSTMLDGEGKAARRSEYAGIIADIITAQLV